MSSELRATTLRGCLEKIIDYRGKTPKKLGSDWTREGYRALSAINVKDSGLTSTETIRCVDAATYKKWMKEEVRRGDILLTSEAPAGEVMIWDSDEKIVLSQRLFCLRVNKRFDNRFIHYYLQSPTGKREVNRTRSGSTVAGISAEMFDQIQVVHPALDTQKKIAAVLSTLDAKIDLNNRINAELEALTKTIYDYWFVQFDFPDGNGRPYKTSGGKMRWNEALKREVPAGWDAQPISALVDVSTATLNPADEPRKWFRHLSIPGFDATGAFWLEEGKSIGSSKFKVETNDLLVSKLNPWFNRVVSDTSYEDFICSTEFVVWRCRDSALHAYLHSIATHPQFIAHCTQSATGTSNSHKRVNPQVMMRHKVPHSSTYAKQLGAMIAPLLMRRTSGLRENRELTHLRDWLLPLLMNGQVRVA